MIEPALATLRLGMACVERCARRRIVSILALSALERDTPAADVGDAGAQ